VRTSPVRLSSFLWSKFWTGLVPIFVLAEALTIASNHLLGVVPFLRGLAACAIAFMTIALVGLACGMGAEHPRFSAENPTQVAGSYGGVAFMVLAVLYILTCVAFVAWPVSLYLWYDYRALPIPTRDGTRIALALAAAATLSVGTFWRSMRRGVRALEALG
jgi:ABC-2 type transport system permease protein